MEDTQAIRKRFEPIYAEIDASKIQIPLQRLLLEGTEIIDAMLYILRLTQLSLRDGVFTAAMAADFIQKALEEMFQRTIDSERRIIDAEPSLMENE